jgi:putative transposase
MGEQGWEGARYGSKHKTTIADDSHQRYPDLVDRNFHAPAPNRLWVADFTYVSTWCGFVYVAFVIDAFSRRIVGWRAATSMTTDLVLDAVEHAFFTRAQEGRRDLTGLVTHNDAGAQGGFNWSSQQRVVNVSVVGRQALPLVFSTRVFCGAGC